jgi:DNA modification methylase
VPTFADALARRLREVEEDAPRVRAFFGGCQPCIVEGSALQELPRLGERTVGLTVTSPPYANRYDYTRTYALELAWLGYDRAAFGALRQALISATVENRPKDELLDRAYGRADSLAHARNAIASQAALAEVLAALEARRHELSNPHVIRLVRNYFAEMAVIIAELGRVTRPGGRVVMVNDNVQYHGEEVPVDLILSDIAEQCGFVCEEIGVLPRGKGNASQQMGRFGRREIRKCVYRWRRKEAVQIA